MLWHYRKHRRERRKKLINGDGEKPAPSPFMFSDHVLSWLDSALDYGIAERDFWELSIAELIRAIDSAKRVQRERERATAAHNYILADLIGRSVARVYNSANNMPSITEAYPSLFDAPEIDAAAQAKQDELSAARFRQFAESFNARHSKKEVAADE